MKSLVSAVFMVCTLCVFQSLQNVNAKQNEGYDLDSDAPIRIGVKKRIKKKTANKRQSRAIEFLYTTEGLFTKMAKNLIRRLQGTLHLHSDWGTGKLFKDMGLQNMCIGEKRKLTISSDLAYGDVGSPPDIHPGATLVFEVELVDILEPNGEDDDYLDYYERSHFTEF